MCLKELREYVLQAYVKRWLVTICVYIVLTRPSNSLVTILTAPQVEVHLRSNTAPNLSIC